MIKLISLLSLLLLVTKTAFSGPTANHQHRRQANRICYEEHLDGISGGRYRVTYMRDTILIRDGVRMGNVWH